MLRTSSLKTRFPNIFISCKLIKNKINHRWTSSVTAALWIKVFSAQTQIQIHLHIWHTFQLEYKTPFITLWWIYAWKITFWPSRTWGRKKGHNFTQLEFVWCTSGSNYSCRAAPEQPEWKDPDTQDKTIPFCVSHIPSPFKTSCVILPYSKAGVGWRATLQKIQ